MEYDVEFENHRRGDRREQAQAEELRRRGEDGYEIDESTGYDPEVDRAMRFECGDWAELLEPGEDAVDPVRVLPQDAILGQKVSERLESEPGVDFSRIGIYCEAGVVTLRGAVRSPEEKRVALDAVSSVPGVIGLNEELSVRGR